MNKMFRLIASICLLLSVSLSVFAVEDELVTRYLTAANEQYSNGNYSKAFSYINNVLGSYKEESVPANVQVLSETIYYAYLGQIKNSRSSSAFNAVKDKLLEFPYLSSERITRTVRIINTYEAQDIAWGRTPAAKVAPAPTSNNNPVLYNTLELQLALEEAKKEAAAQTQLVNDEFQQQLEESHKNSLQQAKEITGTNNRILALSIIILAGICFIVFIMILINIIINMKTAKTQNEKFMETLKSVSQLTRLPSNTPALEALPPLYGASGEMRMIGNSVADTGLPPAPVTESDKKQLTELAQKCKEIGMQIDQVTGRKNNSKNVAEMVYKIVQEMGLSNYEATLYFAIGMVYDIGFLEVDPTLMLLEQLNDNQKYEIRNHVKQGLAQLSFVPEAYMSVFADGVLMHHENMDGSGYPEGLAGDRIPFIARLLHLAESFVALISKRNYRDIFDKEAAVAELRKKPGLYDQKIIDVLDRII